MQPQHVVIETEAPAAVTLATMARTARQAAQVWTFREWAARLATEAEVPRDYVGQLRQLYNEILQRWRYVREPEEWIHGTPKSLIAHVLGTKYNAPEGHDPTQIDLAQVPTTHKGWGDCDDVATVVAAAVLAIGLTPLWRIAKGPGGAHVSVLARLPNGELVSIDPVGHPENPFGWAVEADEILVLDLDGNVATQTALGGVDAMTYPTVYSNFSGEPMFGARNGHWAATHPSDARGPRALAMPARMARMFRSGVVVDGCPAFDENGKSYTYCANRDLWLDDRLEQTRLGDIDDAFGGVGRRKRRRGRRGGGRSGGRAGRRARRKRRRATIRRVVKRVATPLRKVQARISKSKIVQAGASAALGVFGIPPALTRGVLEASGELFERGGLPAVIRLLRKDPRAAARLVAQAAKAGVKRAGGGALSRFAGDIDQPRQYQMQQGGATFYAQPIVALAGVPGLLEFGALDVTSSPLPGAWYRIQRGTNLLKVAEQAWGQRKGRLTKSKWINRVNANRVYLRPTDAGFEKNAYGDGIISFSPKFAKDPAAAIRGEGGNSYAVIFIPEAPGDEPPEVVPDVVVPDVPDVVIPPVEPDVVEPDVVVPDIPPIDEIPPVEPDVVIVPDVDVDDLPKQREKCEAGGGWFVPTEGGHACVMCPAGERWDYFQRMCVPIAPPVEPDIPPELPDIPDVVPCGCPPGTFNAKESEGGCDCVPVDVPDDVDPGGDPCPPFHYLDCPGGGQPCQCVPHVVDPDVEDDEVEPDVSGKTPWGVLGVLYFLFGGGI